MLIEENKKDLSLGLGAFRHVNIRVEDSLIIKLRYKSHYYSTYTHGDGWEIEYINNPKYYYKSNNHSSIFKEVEAILNNYKGVVTISSF